MIRSASSLIFQKENTMDSTLFPAEITAIVDGQEKKYFALIVMRGSISEGFIFPEDLSGYSVVVLNEHFNFVHEQLGKFFEEIIDVRVILDCKEDHGMYIRLLSKIVANFKGYFEEKKALIHKALKEAEMTEWEKLLANLLISEDNLRLMTVNYNYRDLVKENDDEGTLIYVSSLRKNVMEQKNAEKQK